MYQRFHDRFGTAGVVIAVIALVAALGGSALAASGALTGKQKKEVEKIAKKFAGKPGAPGSAGSPGAKGDAGAKGDTGAKGDPGQAGPPGANGKTVLSGTAAPAAALGTIGDFYIRTTTSDIYGPKTAGGWGSPTSLKGSEGSPWTAGGTLPADSTETGMYGVGIPPEGFLTEGEKAFTSASFDIPVVPAPTFVFVPGAQTGGNTESSFGSNPGAGCPGVKAGNVPQADPGKFCVYGVAFNINPTFFVPSATVTAKSPAAGDESPGVTPAGALLELTCAANPLASCVERGLWAVTG
jgi:hypothetical protein